MGIGRKRGLGWILSGYGVLNLAVAVRQLFIGEPESLVVIAAMGVGLTYVGRRLLLSARQDREAAAAAADPVRRLEPSVLALAKQEQGRISVVEVAAALTAPLDEAEATLKSLVSRGVAEELVTESGISIYRFAEFDTLAPASKRDLLEP